MKPPNTIVNLRGTSGAGKSTVAHTLMALFPHEVVERFGARGDRPLVYKLNLGPGRRPLFLIGPYKTQCGGCDAITGYQDVLPPLLAKYAALGHVFFEGLLISGGYGSVGRALGELRDNGYRVVFALLDTPLETCLERITARRAARGVTEPLNPVNTEQKHKAAHNSQKKIAEEYGHECVSVPHRQAVRTVLGLFGLTLNKEPRHARAQG